MSTTEASANLSEVGLILVIEAGKATFENLNRIIVKANDFEVPILGIYSVD